MELKFRVWDRKRKKMIYQGSMIEVDPKNCGDLIYSDIETLAVGMNGERYVLDETGKWEPAESVGEYDVMFFINRLDKNGREIYEGDIIRVFGDIIGVVQWDNATAGFEVKTKSGVEAPLPLGREDIEIIGNTYEDPELLEGKK